MRGAVVVGEVRFAGAPGAGERPAATPHPAPPTATRRVVNRRPAPVPYTAPPADRCARKSAPGSTTSANSLQGGANTITPHELADETTPAKTQSIFV